MKIFNSLCLILLTKSPPPILAEIQVVNNKKLTQNLHSADEKNIHSNMRFPCLICFNKNRNVYIYSISSSVNLSNCHFTRPPKENDAILKKRFIFKKFHFEIHSFYFAIYFIPCFFQLKKWIMKAHVNKRKNGIFIATEIVHCRMNAPKSVYHVSGNVKQILVNEMWNKVCVVVVGKVGTENNIYRNHLNSSLLILYVTYSFTFFTCGVSIQLTCK